VSRIEFLGHATTIIQVDGAVLLTDPLLRRHLTGLVHRHPPVFGALPGTVDAVLISHLHHDHLDVPSLKLLGPTTRVIVPRRGGAFLRRRGFQDVIEAEPGDRFAVGAVHVRATRAVHIGLRAPFGPWGGCLGFVVESSHERVYFAGDTQAFAEMRDLGSIDVALVPIAGWGPVLGPGHMGPRAALEAVHLIRPRVAIPIHWGSLVPFGLHAHTWSYLTRPPLEFVELSRREAPDIRVQVLQPGEAASF
jgi:L-ascorbate metabolism protein UlaG (beta-lactamase superfamily)